jgi:hypothetical protein
MKASTVRDGVSVGATTASKQKRWSSSAVNSGSTSLAQLENVLQRLNKQDHFTHMENMERTTAKTQQQLLKDRLLQGMYTPILGVWCVGHGILTIACISSRGRTGEDAKGQGQAL